MRIFSFLIKASAHGKKYVMLAFLFLVASCSGSRPVQQMNYAEAAFHAASLANAETTQGPIYQLAKDALLRARAAYRLKDFKNARILAIRSRRLSEDAEWRAKREEALPSTDAGAGSADAEGNR